MSYGTGEVVTAVGKKAKFGEKPKLKWSHDRRARQRERIATPLRPKCSLSRLVATSLAFMAAPPQWQPRALVHSH